MPITTIVTTAEIPVISLPPFIVSFLISLLGVSLEISKSVAAINPAKPAQQIRPGELTT